MSSLLVRDIEKWYQVIDKTPFKLATGNEKLLARHIHHVLDWHSEIAGDDDLWDDFVRIRYKTIMASTGLNRQSIWDITRKWSSEGIISVRRRKRYEVETTVRTDVYICLESRFLEGDIAIRDREKYKYSRHSFIKYVPSTCKHCGGSDFEETTRIEVACKECKTLQLVYKVIEKVPDTKGLDSNVLSREEYLDREYFRELED